MIITHRSFHFRSKHVGIFTVVTLAALTVAFQNCSSGNSAGQPPSSTGLVSKILSSSGATLVVPGNSVSVTKFCGNETVDYTSCLTAALNAICASDTNSAGVDSVGNAVGGTLFFPPGTYAFSSITVPCQGVILQGSGRNDNDHGGGTTLVVANSSLPAIHFLQEGRTANNVVNQSAANWAYGGGIRDLEIVSQSSGGTPSTAPSVQFSFCLDCFVQNVYFSKPLEAVRVLGGYNNWISNVFVDQLQPGGVAFEMFGQYNPSLVIPNTGIGVDQGASFLTFTNIYVGQTGTAMSPNSACFYQHGDVGTVNIKDFNCVSQGTGIRSDCNTNNDATGNLSGDDGKCPQFLETFDFQCAGCGAGVTAVDTGSINMINSYMTGSASTNNLISLTTKNFPNTAQAATFINGSVSGAGGSCFWIAESDVTVSGMQIGNCNRGNVSAAGVQVTNSYSGSGQATHNVNVNGNTFSCQNSDSQMTAVYVDNSNPDIITVQDNYYEQCSRGSLITSNGTSISAQSSGKAGSPPGAPGAPAITAAGTWQQPAVAVTSQGVSVNVKTQCIVNGVAPANGDYTNCIQSAINSACNTMASTGSASGTVFFPAGYYLVTNIQVNCSNLTLQGAAGGGDARLLASYMNIRGGTILATYQPPNSGNSNPAIILSGSGDGIQDMHLFNQVGNISPNTSIQFSSCANCFANNIYMWSPTEAFDVLGLSSVAISNVYIDQINLNGTAVEYHGTQGLPGQSLSLSNIDVGQLLGGPVTSTCIKWHDDAKNLSINTMACVGLEYGISTACAPNSSGVPGSQACPNTLNAINFQCDFCTQGVRAIDAFNLNFTNSYFNGNSPGSSNTDTPYAQQNVLIATQNYANAGESATFNGGQNAISQNSCFWVGESNVKINNMGIWGCNLAAEGSAGVEINLGASSSSQTLSNINVNGNTFCSRYSSVDVRRSPTCDPASGGCPAYQTMFGTRITSGGTNLTVSDNIFNGCSAGVYNASWATLSGNVELDQQFNPPFILFPGQSVSYGGLTLLMQQQGNLVLYQNVGPEQKVLWFTPASTTNNRNCATETTGSQNCYAEFQVQGNLVLYQNGQPYWSSGATNSGVTGMSLTAQPPFINFVRTNSANY